MTRRELIKGAAAGAVVVRYRCVVRLFPYRSVRSAGEVGRGSRCRRRRPGRGRSGGGHRSGPGRSQGDRPGEGACQRRQHRPLRRPAVHGRRNPPAEGDRLRRQCREHVRLHARSSRRGSRSGNDQDLLRQQPELVRLAGRAGGALQGELHPGQVGSRSHRRRAGVQRQRIAGRLQDRGHSGAQRPSRRGARRNRLRPLAAPESGRGSSRGRDHPRSAGPAAGGQPRRAGRGRRRRRRRGRGILQGQQGRDSVRRWLRRQQGDGGPALPRLPAFRVPGGHLGRRWQRHSDGPGSRWRRADDGRCLCLLGHLRVRPSPGQGHPASTTEVVASSAKTTTAPGWARPCFGTIPCPT